MAVISQNLEQQLGPNFALHSDTTKDMCLQSIIGISAKLRVLGPSQRFDNTLILDPAAAAASMLSKHIGPTLHVGPNNVVPNIGSCDEAWTS